MSAPAYTPSWLREVYEQVEKAVHVASGLRQSMAESKLHVEYDPVAALDFKAAALALAHARRDANNVLQEAEIPLRTTAAGVWEACRAALEAIEPINHACMHVLAAFGMNAGDHMGGDLGPCPAFEGCRGFTGGIRSYFAAVPPVDERAILEHLRCETRTAAARLDAEPPRAAGSAPTPSASPPVETPPPAGGKSLQVTPSTTPAGAERQHEDINLFQLTGPVWHVQYEEGGEAGYYPDRPDSALRHLARLLAEPNRRLRTQDFYPPPPGAAPLPRYGRDESSDDQTLEESEKELRRLTQEITEAVDAHDTETATRLRERFETLTDHLNPEKGARKVGRKKRCGTLAPEEKADQALRMGLDRAKKSFRRKGLPKLADHLDKYLDHKGGEWWYAPPPDTSPWQVTRPDPPSEN